MPRHVPSEQELQVRAYIGSYLRGRLRDHGGKETYEQIADDLGVSKPYVIKAAREESCGPKLEAAVARKAFPITGERRGSIDDLRDAAATFWKESGAALRQRAELPPELARAVEFMRHDPSADAVPDVFLDEWIAGNGAKPWDGITRHDVVEIIRGEWKRQKHAPATHELEAARQATVGSSEKKRRTSRG